MGVNGYIQELEEQVDIWKILALTMVIHRHIDSSLDASSIIDKYLYKNDRELYDKVLYNPDALLANIKETLL